MTPSSLKKMSGAQGRKEGNYASSERTPWRSSSNTDLGLTLFPGSQIQRKDKKEIGTAAESSLKKQEGKYVERLEQWTAFEPEIQAIYSSQQIAFGDEGQSPSSSPNSGTKSAKFSHVTARINGEQASTQNFNVKDDGDVVQHNANPAVAAPYDELKLVTSEIRSANSCHNDDYSPRAVRERKFESRSSTEIQGSNVSKAKEAVLKTHYDGFSVGHDQGLWGINDIIQLKNWRKSFERIKVPLGGIEGPSKSVSYRQIIPSSYFETAHSHSHQTTNLSSDHESFHASFDTLNAFASKSPAKHQHSGPDRLTLHRQPSSLSKASTKHSKYSYLLPDTTADVPNELSKPRKGVNTSWTRFFPAKAKFSRHANLPAPSSLAAFFTPSEDHQHQHLTSAPLLFTRVQSTPSLPSLLEDILGTAHPRTQCLSPPNVSASMANLRSMRATANMNSSNIFRPSSMPTPPDDQGNSSARVAYSSSLSHHGNAPLLKNVVGPPRNHALTSLNANKPFSQDWQLNLNFHRQHEISPSNRQSTVLTPSSDPCQGPKQPLNHQDMSGLSASNNGVMAAGASSFARPQLDVKPFYSHDEVKSLTANLVNQAHTLQAENTSLQSMNSAMRKDASNLQHEKTDLIRQIQHYERTGVQKDQQINVMQQHWNSLMQKYKKIWGDYQELIAALQKGDGTSNPSAMANKIRGNHVSNASQANANACPVHGPNGTQLSMSRHGFQQTPTGPQGHIQAVSDPGLLGANVADASSRSLRQQLDAAANHNNADPSQTQSVPAYPAPNVANALSQVSLQPRFAGANHNSSMSSHDRSSRKVQSNQPLGAVVGSMTTDGQNDDSPMRRNLRERLTIDLTDDSQPPSSSISRDISKNETPQPSLSDGHSPFNLQSAQHPAEHSVSSRDPLTPSAQIQMPQTSIPESQDSEGVDPEAMQIQKEAIVRMAAKPLLWLRGGNPFRNGRETEQSTELPNSRKLSPSNAEQRAIADSPAAARVAPLPENVSKRNIKKQAPKKSKVVLTAEAKKERAKLYRKTAAEKKKRWEKEAARQSLQGERLSNNAMRAQKQDRRAAKEEFRQEQAQKQSGEGGPREPQRTLDGRFNQGNTGVQKAVHREQAASDDHDSLFGDDEDYQMEMEDPVASPEADSAMYDDKAAEGADAEKNYIADVEALFAGEEDARTRTNVEQIAALGSEDFVSIVPPSGDDGYHDFSSAEESEEE